MPIESQRILADIEAIAGFTETPGHGHSRPTFSPAWRAARDYVVGQLESNGCKVRIDAAGNVHARPSAIGWDAPVWISGSHIDSVPHGGKFDGVVGIVAPLEVVRAAKTDLKSALPLEVVIWAEEEGTTFGLGMLGSRAYVGDLDADKLSQLKNAAGQSYLDAGAAHGVVADKIAGDTLKPNSLVGVVEVHVEQGPELWETGMRVACVNAIAGRRQYVCTFTGVANHAGSTPMNHRQDALVGGAEMIVALEKLARDLGNRAVITVGRIKCKPNAINVIPEAFAFSVDFRSPGMMTLAQGDKSIRSILQEIATRRRLTPTLEVTESQSSVELDKRICAKMTRGASVRQMDIGETVSGALHDAAILAPVAPTAMLFVASRDGISHNPAEYSKIEDIVAATEILFETVRDRRLE